MMVQNKVTHNIVGNLRNYTTKRGQFTVIETLDSGFQYLVIDINGFSSCERFSSKTKAIKKANELNDKYGCEKLPLNFKPLKTDGLECLVGKSLKNAIKNRNTQ